MPEGAKISLIFLILFEKRRQTGLLMTLQTRGMEVSHQKPHSGFYAAHAIVFESHDYCLKIDFCCYSLIYPCLQVHCTEQYGDEADFCSVDFSPTPSSLKLAPKGLCTLIIIRHPICRIYLVSLDMIGACLSRQLPKSQTYCS